MRAMPDLHLRGVAGEFLAERQRRRILRVGAADLDDAGEFLGLLVERLCRCVSAGQQPVRDLARPPRYASRSGS